MSFMDFDNRRKPQKERPIEVVMADKQQPMKILSKYQKNGSLLQTLFLEDLLLT